jgi:hypothetical protein
MKARFAAAPLGGPVSAPALRPLTTADAGTATATPAAAPAKPAAAKTAKS